MQFVIPVYQRNYDWTNTECKELLNDIISVKTEDRETHFTGSIVFVHKSTYSSSEVKELVIIDGRQRLTTINILYVALYRFAKENGNAQDAERLYNMFWPLHKVQPAGQHEQNAQLKCTSLNF